MLSDKAEKTIIKHRLIKKKDTIVLGVSGGPDSVALLFFMRNISKKWKIKLHVAHLDHGLRKESIEDKTFVESLTRKLGIPFTSAKININALAKEGKGSIEEIARNARLAFLFRLAKDLKTKKIALAHNLDDQAETVLMRILRGTGLIGMSGMQPKKSIAGFEIIRPFIEVSRKEIEAYLKRRRICVRIDSTNSKNIYFRNKVRNKLIPYLEKEYNANIKKVLANTAQIVSCDYDYLVNASRKQSKDFVNNIAIDKLLRLHPAILRLVLRLAIERLKGDTRRITFQHILEIEDLILNRPIGSIVDLPKCISVAKRKKTLLFYRRKK